MNIDYALCEAIEYTCGEGIETVLLAYDINCQYSVHLPERLERGEYLKVRDDLLLVFGIGLFHVHGHQASCNARYSLTYIRGEFHERILGLKLGECKEGLITALLGAGMSAGEILESLWSVVNEAARTTSTMSLGHRAEVLDSVMGDSNWKKILTLGESVKSRQWCCFDRFSSLGVQKLEEKSPGSQ
jgi:Kyakuja-Dileera-Zisupton transposase